MNRSVLHRVAVVILATLFTGIPSISSASPTPSVLFFVDSSGSMRGEKLAQVKEAIGAVLPKLSEPIPVAIYVFNDQVKEVQPATLDRVLLSSKLASIEAKGKTSLYDALIIASEIYQSLGNAKVVILSDGRDTASQTSYKQVVAAMLQLKASFDIVGLQVNTSTGDELKNIASASNGNYYPVSDLGELVDLYGGILQQESRIALELSSPRKVEIPSNRAFEIGLLTLVALTTLLVAFLSINLISVRKAVSNRTKLIQLYGSRRTRTDLRKLGKSIVSLSLVPGRIEKSMKKRLEELHLESKYRNAVFFCLLGILGSSIFISAFVGNLFFSLFLGVIVTVFLFDNTCKRILKNQRKKFDEELPEMLNVVASGLSAGLGLQQSLEAYASESEGEVSTQLRRVLAESRVGTPIDEALMSVAERMDNESMKWVVTALSIQRVVGGSLATVIRNAYETIRSRSEIRREVRTLSAEGRISGNVLVALPLVIFAFLFITRREYVSLFWSNPLGLALLCLIAFNIAMGILWTRKIVDIKI